MTLKLFHITEFAESALLSPEKQREALHPVIVISLVSLWLTVVCNYPLWRELARLPLEGFSLWWLDLRLALLMTFGLNVLFSLLCWRRIFKLAATLMLLLAALNTSLMLHQASYLDLGSGLAAMGQQLRQAFSWPLVGWFLALGLLPALWLWRLPVRRIPLLINLLQNLALLVLSGALLAGSWWLSQPEVPALLRQQPQLQRLLNPWSSFQRLAPAQIVEHLPR